MAQTPRINYARVTEYLATIGLDASEVAQEGNTETTYSRATLDRDGFIVTTDTPWPDGFDWAAFQDAHQ